MYVIETMSNNRMLVIDNSSKLMPRMYACMNGVEACMNVRTWFILPVGGLSHGGGAQWSSMYLCQVESSMYVCMYER